MPATRQPDGTRTGHWGRRVRQHLSELVRLAWPVVLARTGIITMVLADTIMTARYGTKDVAYLGIGMAPVVVIIVTTVGLMMGTLVVTANAFGSGRLKECGAIWRRSTRYALGLGVASLMICAFGETFLSLTGQTPEIAKGGGRVLLVLGLGLPANLLFVTNSFFLEAIKRPLPGMIAMISMNILNVVLNWLLIYGKLGFPKAGAVGAAAATSTARCGLAVILFLYIWNMRDHAAFGVRTRAPSRWRDWVHQRRLGYATGTTGAIESGAFSFMTLFAGWLGTYAVGAYSLAMNLMSLVFMVALGLATATAVRVSIAQALGDHRDIALAGWTGLGVNTAAMSMLGLVLFTFPAVLAGVYTRDTALMDAAAPVIAFTAFVIVADGGQIVMLNALRGRGDTWTPVLAHAVSYIGVMVPVGWLLAFKLDHGVLGLVQGILVASLVSVVLLSARFHHLSARDARFVASTPSPTVGLTGSGGQTDGSRTG